MEHNVKYVYVKRAVDKSQIPYLVKLLDDESPTVRRHVTEKLRELGPDLEVELEQFKEQLSADQLTLLKDILRQQQLAARRREAWLEWPTRESTYDQLERAYELLAEFQYDWKPPVELGALLDELAEDYRQSGRPLNPLGLSRFLFITKKFRGNVDDYYDPLNSNLIHVVQSRQGIPISLASLFMLVGRRIGFVIHGCNVPSHFLAMADLNGERMLFDCFNRGRVLTRSESHRLRQALSPQFAHIIDEPSTAVEIIARVLRNLINAYDMTEDADKRDQAIELLRDIAPDQAG